MKKGSLIRTIYLYLFALVGLTLLVIGFVMLVNLGLKMFVFKQADPAYVDRPSLSVVRIGPEKTITDEDFVSAIEKCQEKCELTEDQQIQMESWLADYQVWQTYQTETDYRAERRQKDAARAFSFILIGLPLYLFHWTVIRKETKEKA